MLHKKTSNNIHVSGKIFEFAKKKNQVQGRPKKSERYHGITVVGL